MRKTLSDFYEDYKIRYNGVPKHSFSHFIRVISMLEHHRKYIRPKIEWWSNFDIKYKKELYNLIESITYFGKEIPSEYLPVLKVMREIKFERGEELLERVSSHPDVIAFFRNKKLDELGL